MNTSISSPNWLMETLEAAHQTIMEIPIRLRPITYTTDVTELNNSIYWIENLSNGEQQEFIDD